MTSSPAPQLHAAEYTARIGRLARQAAEQEVSASPKPGLVCPDHQGAHTDMDHTTFMASAAALEPYFAQCAALGHSSSHLPPFEVFPLLRSAGQQAERAMFAATGGVNTHKGLIFSLGLICAALGRLHQPPAQWPNARAIAHTDVCSIAHTVAATAATFIPDITQELAALASHPPARPLTAGERLYLEHRVCGIRGEAAHGFPHALYAHERLLHHAQHLPEDRAVPHTLLELMAVTPDTNVLARGGARGLRFVHAGARAALHGGGMYTPAGRAAVLRLRDTCTHRRLSPGGCADLLTLALFWRAVEHNNIHVVLRKH